MGLIEILLIVIVLLSIANLVFMFQIRKEKKQALTNSELDQIKSIIISCLDPVTKNISTIVELQNKVFMEQVEKKLEEMKKTLEDINKTNHEFEVKIITTLTNHNENSIVKLNNEFKEISRLINDNNDKSIRNVSDRLNEFSKLIKEKMDSIDNNVESKMEKIRNDNNEKLDKIQGVVDEKLQKTLEERLNNSFKNVIEQIGGVNKAIGEIKGLATDVSSLKNVLANVKTKGIVGEVILSNLIKEILTPSQYEENIATKKGSKDVVEFAIKMPGDKDDESVYLPIDSKFPTSSYTKILEAIENGDKLLVESARKELRTNIKKFANDISSKYIDEPNTTGFAIMFLPIEGLYAEVINLGLFEELQREYKVCVCGPSTFAALLNALQMGFKSLVIQKKSAEVFKLLGAIKTEFNTFAEALDKTQTKMDQASKELNNLVGTRTRVMQRKLRDIEEVSALESREILELENE